MLTILLAVFAVAGCQTSATNVLPEAKDVRSINIELELLDGGDTVVFAATHEDWKEIRAAMLPLVGEDLEHPWEFLAEITLVRNDGQVYGVSIWRTWKKTGAYYTGPANRDEFSGYRGGDSEAMIKALDAAYQRAQTAGRVIDSDSM